MSSAGRPLPLPPPQHTHTELDGSHTAWDILTRDTHCANVLAPRMSVFALISQIRSQSMYPGNQTSLTM